MKGFTLIEVLIAIVVVATGLVLLVEAMGRSQQAIGISQNVITASRLAEEKLAEVELEARQGKSLRSSTDKGSERVRGREFVWAKQTGPYNDPLIEDQTKMSEAETQVQWKESGGIKREVELATLFMKRETKDEG